MEYFAGLDVSMSETHVCVVTQDGAVVHQVRAPSTPADIAAALARVPACRRILFETGRMAPMLYHGLSQLGLPVVCVESRQAYQALKSLATHKTDRNDARGLSISGGLPDGAGDLIGDHDGLGSDIPGELADALSGAMKEMNGDGIWRNPKERGIGAHPYEAQIVGKRDDLRKWKLRTLALLRRHATPDPR